MKFLSHLFSWVFLPLFMPSYGILISLFVPAFSSDLEMTSLYFAPTASKWALFTIFFLFSVVAPGVSFILLHRFKVISTIDIERQGERSLPLVIMLVYSLVLFFLLIYKAGEGTTLLLCTSAFWCGRNECFFIDQSLDKNFPTWRRRGDFVGLLSGLYAGPRSV